MADNNNFSFHFSQKLSADISYDNMRNLLEDFGTHYTTDVVMGARFGVMNEFTKKGYENAVETGLNVGASATYSGLFEAGVSYSKEVHSKSRKKFEELRKNYKIYSYGSRIPTSGNSSIWASESSKTPLPISLKMRTIADLFTDKWLWNSWTTTNRYPYKIDYKKIRPHLMRFLFSHCQLLIDNEKIKECYLKSLSGPGNYCKPWPNKLTTPFESVHVLTLKFAFCLLALSFLSCDKFML